MRIDEYITSRTVLHVGMTLWFPGRRCRSGTRSFYSRFHQIIPGCGRTGPSEGDPWRSGGATHLHSIGVSKPQYTVIHNLGLMVRGPKVNVLHKRCNWMSPVPSYTTSAMSPLEFNLPQLTYPVTRGYPWPFFTPLVLIVGLISLGILIPVNGECHPSV